MKKSIILIAITLASLNLEARPLFKQAGHNDTYQDLVEQAKYNKSLPALNALHKAWQPGQEAAKFAFIGQFLTENGYSAAHVAAELAAATHKPVPPAHQVPVQPIHVPIVSPVPSAPGAPPMAPGIPMAPGAPSAPRMAPGMGESSVAMPSNSELITMLQELLPTIDLPAERDFLNSYLKKLEAGQKLKNYELTKIQGLYRTLESKKEEEQKLAIKQKEMEEKFKQEGAALTSNMKEIAVERFKKEELKSKIPVALTKVSLIVIFEDEVTKEIESLKERLKSIDEETDLKVLKNDLDVNSEQLKKYKEELEDIQRDLKKEKDPSNILNMVTNMQNVSAQIDILEGTIQAIKNQKRATEVTVKQNLENQIAILQQLFNEQLEELKQESITKVDAIKLLKSLGISDQLGQNPVADALILGLGKTQAILAERLKKIRQQVADESDEEE